MNDLFQIKSETARQVWENFDRELVHKLKILPAEERTDIRMEILSHLFESANNLELQSLAPEQSDSEEVRLINAISKLGSPDEYLEPLITDILLHQQAAKGNPVAILKSLKHKAKKGIFHALTTLILGMGYFWVIMIFIMAVMHIVNPNVGIWYYETGQFSLSFSAQPDATQWQTGWFSLIGIAFSTISYWLLNKLLSYTFSRSK